MALRFTPSLRNQAGNKLIKIYSGKPELKPVKIQMSIFLLTSDCQMDGCAVVCTGVVWVERCV